MISIKELRARHNLTQAELGKEIGVSAYAVYSWEKDISTINAVNLKKLAEYFNVSADDLLDIKLK